METELTFDHFIARQVQAQLAGEVMDVNCYAGNEVMQRNRGIKGPKGGMVWCFVFAMRGQPYWYGSPYELWYVNLTQRKVIAREKHG